MGPTMSWRSPIGIVLTAELGRTEEDLSQADDEVDPDVMRVDEESSTWRLLSVGCRHPADGAHHQLLPESVSLSPVVVANDWTGLSYGSVLSSPLLPLGED
ncbi:hypothetical protein PanWU01x14_090290 [Parasponia andersonii]|uniref:Uncharacterized protein n=1 Tax=Parasponia andersonii TaxID=3476 RepID=A0A2P5D7T3_PARAD|nr:hypothetical protein PanWU01x14_090290 [Parasponia andersonii]